jgi:hypothetical protein
MHTREGAEPDNTVSACNAADGPSSSINAAYETDQQNVVLTLFVSYQFGKRSAVDERRECGASFQNIAQHLKSPRSVTVIASNFSITALIT